MKENLILLSFFLVYFLFFKDISNLTVESKANLIIVFSFISVFILFIDYKKIKIVKDINYIKAFFLEFLVFFLGCFLYSFFMSYFLNFELFYHFNDLLIYLPLILIFNIGLTFLGYREKNDLFIYGNKFLIFRKTVLKIFFIPFIYSATFDCLNRILMIDDWDLRYIDYYFYIFGLTIDVTIAFFGYAFSSNLLNNEIKSVDNTLKGWVVCIICYPPFFYFYQLFLSQADQYTWKDWAIGAWYYYPWLFLIVSTWIIYWMSTFSFGFKFSNLTWRGLVKTGMYYYIKHPAYLSKNIYWWLYTVPFFGVYGFDIITNIIALATTNLIYYARARTEEQHLMRFEEYREYNEWIKQNGLWAKFKKYVNKMKAHQD